MSLDNATIQHPLPGDLQSRVENALNLVTSLEAEHARLYKLISSQKSDINTNHEEVKSLETRIARLKVEADQSGEELIAHTSSVDTRKRELAELELKIAEAIKEKQIVADQIAQAERDLDFRKHSVEALEGDVTERESILHAKEVAHEKKVAKLLEALK